jgi:two-component system, NtrC family, nitrogen regulation sensor histidine kinase NtrY
VKPLRRSLGGRLLACSSVAVGVTAAVAAAAAMFSQSVWLGLGAGILAGLPILVLMTSYALNPTLALLRAVSGAVHSVRDGDFNTSLRVPREFELAELVNAHNALGEALRDERQHLRQRELLLDTVVQNTPVALVLTEPRGRVVYSNLAARRLFNDGRRLEGVDFTLLLDHAPAALRAAAAVGNPDQLCTLQLEGQEEVFHVSRRGFRLHGRAHDLFLFRRQTQELARQEVKTWKQLIRVISHELNNSLAPISSMAHSGAELLRRGETARLGQVFATIEERAHHLDTFISGYAQFAKLPNPRLQPVEWAGFVAGLREQFPLLAVADVPGGSGRFDPSQLAQALINLLTNAFESGSAPEQVSLAIRPFGPGWTIDVADRGPGMSEAVLANALVPFYSTKRSGTGLGLALAREITEAHGGRISLTNRAGGGLVVSLQLPG